MLERLNEEIRRRTYVVRIFPNSASCRLVRALAVETHENGLEVHRSLNRDDLKRAQKSPAPPSRLTQPLADRDAHNLPPVG